MKAKMLKIWHWTKRKIKKTIEQELDIMRKYSA